MFWLPFIAIYALKKKNEQPPDQQSFSYSLCFPFIGIFNRTAHPGQVTMSHHLMVTSPLIELTYLLRQSDDYCLQ